MSRISQQQKANRQRRYGAEAEQTHRWLLDDLRYRNRSHARDREMREAMGFPVEPPAGIVAGGEK